MWSYFIISAFDREGCLDLRLKVRSEHVAYVRANTPETVKLAGPYINQHGEMIGSMLIISARTREEAERFIANDPYSKAGLFADVRVDSWKPAIGALGELGVL